MFDKNEIIEMAKLAGAFELDTGEFITDDVNVIVFAKLVAAKEREACAKVCDEQAKRWEESAEFESIAGSVTDMARAGTAANIADTIRARGEA